MEYHKINAMKFCAYFSLPKMQCYKIPIFHNIAQPAYTKFIDIFYCYRNTYNSSTAQIAILREKQI